MNELNTCFGRKLLRSKGISYDFCKRYYVFLLFDNWPVFFVVQDVFLNYCVWPSEWCQTFTKNNYERFAGNKSSHDYQVNNKKIN